MKYHITKYRQWMGHKGPVYTLLSFDEQSFMSAGSDGRIIRWNLEGEAQGIVIGQIPSQIFCLAYIPQHQLLLAGCMDGHCYVLDLVKKICIRNIDLQNGSIFSIQYHQGSIYIGTQNGLLYIMNEQFEIMQSIKISDASLRSIIAVAEMNCLFIASSDKCIYEFNTSSLKVDSILRAANHSVFSLAYDSKNKHLYSGSRDAQLYKHSLDGQANQAVQIAAHLFTINDIVVSNELQMLFTASRDKTIKLWSLQNNKLLKVIDQKFDAHKNSVNKLLYLASRNLLISASDDSAVIAWHLQTEA